MPEDAAPGQDAWKDKVAEVAARDLRGVFAILCFAGKKRIAVLPDPDSRLDAKGIEILLGSYVPPGYAVSLWPAEPKVERLAEMEEGELLYTYNKRAYQARLEFLSAEARPAKRPLFSRPPDPTASVVGKMALAALIQTGVLLFIMVFAGSQEPSLLKPKTLVTWIGGAILVALPFNFVLIKFGAVLGGFFMKIMGHSGDPAKRGYSREIALAARGEREEAIRLLEDRFSVNQDPQALREALRAALRKPPMPEESRRIIQELLRLGSVSSEEKARLKQDLAALG